MIGKAILTEGARIGCCTCLHSSHVVRGAVVWCGEMSHMIRD
jgi:hypothetical protein